jgi:hypothetical protein
LTIQRQKLLKILTAAAIAFAALFASTRSDAAKVKVRAATRLEGRVDRNVAGPSGVVIRGTLRDDVGRPVPYSHVAIAFYEGSTVSGSAVKLSGSPRDCGPIGGSEAHDPHVAPDEYFVDTDAQGSFCIVTAVPLDRGTMALRFEGSSLYDKTAAEIAFDLATAAITLAFDPDPSSVSLDRPVFLVWLRVNSQGLPREGWRVVLRDENKRVLGTAPVGPDGLVRIDVPTERFGDPGPGELTAELEGAPAAARAASHAIERHVRVELALAGPQPQGAPEDGISFEVTARSSRGPVGTGSVEATIGDRTVGAARVRAGRAALVATFASTRDASVPTSLHYLPDAPWFEPGPELVVGVGVHAPSAWRRAPPILLALAVAAWMTRRAWLPRISRLSFGSRAEPHGPGVTEQRALQVIRNAAPDQGWSGRVVDAHDGHAIDGAIVSIVVPSFPGSPERPNAEVVTRGDGSFAIERMPVTGKPLLRVRAPWHATFEQPLPPPSEVSIPMVARRRRLLDRLVAWASREWGPLPGAREPTPEQIASHAKRTRDRIGPERAAGVEAWARAVEWAAYGRAEVDEHTERSVSSLEPDRRRAGGRAE